MRHLWLLGVWFFLSAFGPSPQLFDPPPGDPAQPRTLLVFLDGTRNDQASNTNVHKLYDAVVTARTAAGKTDTAAFYIEGVGTGYRLIGAATGWGISYRVRQAYAWLLQRWRPGDRIAIFGFSRGAYSARILASLLQHAGLPAQPLTDRQRALAMADVLFDAVKQRKATAATRMDNARRAAMRRRYPPLQAHVPIAFMGLWDTVEALGDPTDDPALVDLPNTRYGDQLCNVERAAHAVAADDNRATVYRPVLLTGAHLLADCPQGPGTGGIDARVEEVWFTGAHSDVGGSEVGDYAKRRLGGVTLNWMLAEPGAADLLAGIAPFPANPADVSGNGYDATKPIGKPISRTLAVRQRTIDHLYNAGRIKVHSSVIQNLAKRPRALHELDWASLFPACFATAGGRATFRPDQPCCPLGVVADPALPPMIH
jgi:uncharacterized protein (DUF2235 family)